MTHPPFGPFVCRYLQSVTTTQKEVHLNATELARDKFNALFAAHDAKNEREASQEEKLALKTDKKATTKNVKPQ
jgi:hypothetical protein